MIISLRIEKILDELWFRFKCPFSYQKAKSTLSFNAQKAVWASANITKILNAKNPDVITDPSLRQQLINLQHPADAITDQTQRQKILNIKDLFFDQQPRKEILDIYKIGVTLQPEVFKQQRIINAKEPARVLKQAKFIFCPNLLVTRDIFDILVNNGSSLLIYGGFGISKTASLILFSYLSSVINKFIYESYSDNNLKEQLKFLNANNLILEIPKIFYWSLNAVDDQQILISLLLDQATELSQNQKAQLGKIKKLTEFISLLKKKYFNKVISTKCIVDQINILGSYFRKWNNFYINYQLDNKQWVSKYQKFEGIKLQGELLRNRMKQFQKLGSSTFYNSSINIEKDLLAVQQQGNLYCTIDIQNNHEPIRESPIKYIQNLDTKWGCIDFSHIFWFQIQKKLKSRIKLTDQKIQKFKTVFYQKLKDMKWPKYLRFLNVRRMLQKKTVQLQIVYSNLQNNTDIEGTAFKLINLLLESSVEDYQQNLQTFINKSDNQQVKQVKISLFIALVQQARKQMDQNKLFEIQVGTLSNDLQIYFGKTQEQKNKKKTIIEQILRERSLHKQLFSIQQNSNKVRVIKFLWTRAQFITIAQTVILKLLMGPKEIDSITKKVLNQKAETLGSFLENWLCVLLNIPQTYSTYYYYNTDRKIYEKKSFETKDSDSFIQFNKKQSNTPNNFKKMIKKAIDNPNEYIFGHPIRQQLDKNKQIKQIHGCKSKTVDYAFMIYNSDTKKFKIYSFDITVTSTQGKVEKKLETAKLFLENDVKMPQNFFWHHTILCSSNINYIFLNNPPKWKIQTSNFDYFDIRNNNSKNMRFNQYFRYFAAYREIFKNYAAGKKK